MAAVLSYRLLMGNSVDEGNSADQSTAGWRIGFGAALAALALLILTACGGTDVDTSGPLAELAEASDEVAQALSAAENPEDLIQAAPAQETDDGATDDGAADDEAADADAVEGQSPEPAVEDLAIEDLVPGDESAAMTPVSWDGSFTQTIQPILAEKCAACHAPAGPGAIHWQLGTVQDVVDTSQLIAAVVQTGVMPPWIAGGESPAFHNDRSLRADQLQAILDWADDGAPIDADPSTPIEPSVDIVRLTDPTDVVTQVAYTGPGTPADDYRCQLYELELPENGWITGFEFIPDNTAVVHHMIGYLVQGNALDRAAEIDGADGRPGWPCYGTSGLGGGELIVGWAPGQEPFKAPDGYGLPIPARAAIVAQIHYHYDSEATADASQFAVTTEQPEAGLQDLYTDILIAPAEIPCYDSEVGPLCDREAAFAAAVAKYGGDGVLANVINSACGVKPEDFAEMTDGVAWSECTVPARPGRVVSVLGHMHEIGDSFRMVRNKGTADEEVLLEIPDWDFDWQYQYEFVEDVFLNPGDSLTIECQWDKSRRDADLEPAWIVWADGTNDEMCFATARIAPEPFS